MTLSMQLHTAALQGEFELVQDLLAQGANPNDLNKRHQNALFSALFLPVLHSALMKQNKIKIFHLLSEQIHNLAQQDESGDTILQVVAASDFANLVPSLLEASPELPCIANNQGHYPIHTAILNAQPETVASLLAQPNVSTLRDDNGWTPLHYAACYGAKDILDLCIAAEPNLEVVDLLGQTPLMLAVSFGRLDMVQALIQAGANLHCRNLSGFTLLHQAVHHVHPEIVSWLLANTDIKPGIKDKDHHTALALGKLEGRTEFTKLESLLPSRGEGARKGG